MAVFELRTCVSNDGMSPDMEDWTINDYEELMRDDEGQSYPFPSTRLQKGDQSIPDDWQTFAAYLYKKPIILIRGNRTVEDINNPNNNLSEELVHVTVFNPETNANQAIAIIAQRIQPNGDTILIIRESPVGRGFRNTQWVKVGSDG